MTPEQFRRSRLAVPPGCPALQAYRGRSRGLWPRLASHAPFVPPDLGVCLRLPSFATVSYVCRVAFIEFASVDRFHRGVWIPFAQGMLRLAALETIWIRFGVRANARMNQSEPGISLPESEVGPLTKRLREFAATHVIFDRLPSPSLINAIGEARPLRMAFVSESGGAKHGLPCLPPSPEPLASFVDLDTERAKNVDFFSEIVPDFSWVSGNEPATKAPSLPFLVCGEECTFCDPIRRNPTFAGVDIKRCARQYGCSFCVRPSGRTRWKQSPLELFRRQMKALRDSHPAWIGQLLVRAVGEPVVRNIEAIAEALVELDVPPVALLLDARADTILQERDSLDRGAERLRTTPHAIHMSLVGIESLVADELLLYNKGLRWEQNLDAIAALLDLECRHGSHFDFHTYGGLSLILQSPWTRPEHLSTNLAIIRRAGLSSLTGKVFTSRLRLYPSLPLYELARKEGLVMAAYEDPLLDTARKNLYDDEVPWRFRNPGMHTISRLLVRMDEGADVGDPLALAMCRALSEGGGLDGQLALAEAVVDSAMEMPERSPVEVVRAAAQRMNPAPLRGSEGYEDAGRNRSLLALAMSVGLKPVVRLEHSGDYGGGVGLQGLGPRGQATALPNIRGDRVVPWAR